MATDIGMCNTALVLVGAEQIQSLSEAGRREATVCSAIYATTRDALLQKFPWVFTLEQASLAKTATTPLFDYEYEFQLPVNSLRVIKTDAANQDYRVLQDKLFANVDPIEILHQIDPGEAEYPAYFVRTLELRLAELLATALIQDERLSQVYERKYISSVREARATDSVMAPNRSIEDSQFSLTSVRGTDG